MLPTCHLVTPGATVKDTPASAGLEAGGQDKASRMVFGVAAGPASGTLTLPATLDLVHRGQGYLSLSHTQTHIYIHTLPLNRRIAEGR